MAASSPEFRALFEAYILTERGRDYLKRHGGNYADHFVQEAWEAWHGCYDLFVGNSAPLIKQLVIAAQRAEKALFIVERDLKTSTIYGETAAVARQAYDELRGVLESEAGVICGVCGKLHEHDAPNCLDKTVRPLGY